MSTAAPIHEPIPKPIPDVTDEVAAPYWAAAREHRLVQQRCSVCGTFSAPPVEACHHCHAPAADLQWVAVSGRGVLHTFNVYHRAYHPGFAADVPYNTAIVELDEGPFLPTRIVGVDNEALEVGARVRVVFEPHAARPDIVMPYFTLSA